MTPRCFSSCAAGERPPSSAIARNRCSVLTNSSFRRSASACARSVTSFSRGDRPGCEPPYACGNLRRAARAPRGAIGAGSTPIFRSSFGHDAFALLDERDEQVLRLDLRVVASARRAAARRATASRAFSVYLLIFMIVVSLDCQRRLDVELDAMPQFFVVCSSFCSASKCVALLRRQLARQLHVDRRVEVAASRPACRRPASRGPSAGTPAVLRRRRNLQPQRLAAERLHLRLAAEHRGRQRNRRRACRGRVPLRSNFGCGASRIRRYRSPDCAPPAPRSPSPATRTREPSPTPAGIRTSTVRAWPSCLIDKPPRRAVVARPRAPARSPARRRGPGARPRPRPPRVRRPRSSAARRAAEERVEEVGERIAVAEHLAHLVFASSCGSRRPGARRRRS